MNRQELQSLYKSVCEILWHDWDPIGVNDSSTADDEYDGYAATICRYLLNGADEYKLTAHLRQLRTVSMGLEMDDEHDRRVANKLLNLMSKKMNTPGKN